MTRAATATRSRAPQKRPVTTRKPSSPRKSSPRSTPKPPPFQLPAFYPSTQYFNQSRLPWPSLLFLLPLMFLYEVGTRTFAIDAVRHTEVRIIAFTLMQDFFHLFGVTGRALPALAVVGILLSWHIARADAWRIKPVLLLKMTGESAVLGLPVILLSVLCASRLPLSTAAPVLSWKGMLVVAVGAGVYEELIFRLISFTLLSLVVTDLLRLRKDVATLVIVLLPALLFSLYHYLGPEPFAFRSFVFRTLAGIYFGLLFLFRGFGITAGSHAAYDALIVLLTQVPTAHH